jgi:hypothetical protein
MSVGQGNSCPKALVAFVSPAESNSAIRQNAILRHEAVVQGLACLHRAG